MSKDEAPKCVAQCFSIEGAVDVSFDGLLENKCEEMNNGLNSLQKNLTRLKELDKSLMIDLDRIGETLGQIASIYMSISENYVSLEESKMMEIFISLAEVFTKTSTSIIQLKSTYSTGISKFISSHNKELQSMNDLMQEWKQAQERLSKAYGKLDEKKKGILDKIPIDKWEIKNDCLRPADETIKGIPDLMLEESKEVDKSRELYGYLSNRIPEEFKRIWVKNGKSFRANFYRVSERYTDLVGQVRFVFIFFRCKVGGVIVDFILRN